MASTSYAPATPSPAAVASPPDAPVAELLDLGTSPRPWAEWLADQPTVDAGLVPLNVWRARAIDAIRREDLRELQRVAADVLAIDSLHRATRERRGQVDADAQARVHGWARELSSLILLAHDQVAARGRASTQVARVATVSERVHDYLRTAGEPQRPTAIADALAIDRTQIARALAQLRASERVTEKLGDSPDGRARWYSAA